MKIRHGDVLLESTDAEPQNDKKLDHLVLAEGEITGHAHRINGGNASSTALLYDHDDDQRLLEVKSESVQLTHEEHNTVTVPQGTWIVRIQREYQPEGWRYVQD